MCDAGGRKEEEIAGVEVNDELCLVENELASGSGRMKLATRNLRVKRWRTHIAA